MPALLPAPEPLEARATPEGRSGAREGEPCARSADVAQAIRRVGESADPDTGGSIRALEGHNRSA
jgi:hypothetical protein